MNTFTYVIGDKIYINLTNKCSNDCTFCIRNGAQGIEGYSLWLDREPTVEEVIAELKDKGVTNFAEVVFCGFGEPIYRYEAIKEISNFVHSCGGTTRINTNGQAALILGRDITPEFGKYMDIVNVSLNATDAKAYDAICKSCYGEGAYSALLEFTRGCVKSCKKVILSVVDCIGTEEIAKAKIIADSVGATLRVREEI